MQPRVSTRGLVPFSHLEPRRGVGSANCHTIDAIHRILRATGRSHLRSYGTSDDMIESFLGLKPEAIFLRRFSAEDAYDRSILRSEHSTIGRRRLGELGILQREIAAWSADVNNSQRGIDWRMKIHDARYKLKSAYPKSQC